MSKRPFNSVLVVSLSLMFLTAVPAVCAQEAGDVPVILPAETLARIVPPGFYFEGQSAPTQMRNAAAARFGKKNVLAGMVDTTGYSSDVRAKYEGFFITDAAIVVGSGGVLPAGAYGFGFTESGQFNIFDVGGSPLMSATTTNDATMLRPRPLAMTQARDGLRLYSGRRYVLITARPKEAEL